VAEHDLSRAYGFGGNAGVGLQSDPEVGSSTACTGATHDLVASSERDRGPGGSGKVLRAFRDRADRRLQIKFGCVNLDILSNVHRTKT
jgi:hypothetical protein